jgi:hypothetical protein
VRVGTPALEHTSWRGSRTLPTAFHTAGVSRSECCSCLWTCSSANTYLLSLYTLRMAVSQLDGVILTSDEFGTQSHLVHVAPTHPTCHKRNIPSRSFLEAHAAGDYASERGSNARLGPEDSVAPFNHGPRGPGPAPHREAGNRHDGAVRIGMAGGGFMSHSTMQGLDAYSRHKQVGRSRPPGPP